MPAMQPHWHEDVARHLREAATSLSGSQMLAVRRELGTAIGYLLRAAGDGDDDAFELLKVLRSGIDDAEPTQVIDLDAIEE
jgi:hypothetical protein